jgi:hypothetical protein
MHSGERLNKDRARVRQRQNEQGKLRRLSRQRDRRSPEVDPGVSQPLKELAPIPLPLRDDHGMELYYNFAITPCYQITPDI